MSVPNGHNPNYFSRFARVRAVCFKSDITLNQSYIRESSVMPPERKRNAKNKIHFKNEYNYQMIKKRAKNKTKLQHFNI